jgi:hypothetical protein
MNREERTVFLVFLTWMLYALGVLVDNGRLIFPFPLNEIAFLLVSALFVGWNRKADRKQLLLFSLVAIFQLLSTQFFWTFIVSDQTMEHLVHSIWLDFFSICFYIALLIWMRYFLVKTALKFRIPILFVFVSVLSYAIVSSNFWLETGVIVSFAALVVFRKIHAPFQLLWLLLAMFDLVKLITIVS